MNLFIFSDLVKFLFHQFHCNFDSCCYPQFLYPYSHKECNDNENYCEVQPKSSTYDKNIITRLSRLILVLNNNNLSFHFFYILDRTIDIRFQVFVLILNFFDIRFIDVHFGIRLIRTQFLRSMKSN